MPQVLIIPGRADQHSLVFWVRVSSGSTPKIKAAQVVDEQSPAPDDESRPIVESGIVGISIPDEHVALRRVTKHIWLVAARELTPATLYSLSVTVGNVFEKGYSRTLPVVSAPRQTFTMAFSSCYEVSNDSHGRARFFPPRLDLADSAPDLRILLGDQVYMDLNPKTGKVQRDPPNPDARHLMQWNKAPWRTYLEHAPSLTLIDDHELWNNYPHPAAQLSQILDPINDIVDFFEDLFNLEDGQNFAGNWFDALLNPLIDIDAFHRAIGMYQSALNVPAADVFDSPDTQSYWEAELLDKRRWRTFSLNDSSPDLPVRVFGLDVRSFRNHLLSTNPSTTREVHLELLEAWIDGLDRPGVLCLSQPLLDPPSLNLPFIIDANLANYKKEHAYLCRLLGRAKHSVLVVAGDIHSNRLRQIVRPNRPDHFELIASPHSRIDGNADASKGSNGSLAWAGLDDVHWQRLYAFASKHSYTTVTFSQTARGEVQAIVQPWILYKWGARPVYAWPPEAAASAEGMLDFVTKIKNDPVSLQAYAQSWRILLR